MTKSIYDIIKKQNGENFAKTIRNYDSGIFDIKNIDKIVKFAGREAEAIINYLISLKDIKIEEHGVHKSPFDLLREVGYISIYADTLEKQNNPDFQSLYAKGEKICTFHDPHRFENYYIVHCVKENISEINRPKNPQREDEYGTSVISIQIAKKGGFISIKNRYNHTVNACDNTFDSNPDNIILGLSESLKYHFGVDFSSQNVALPNGYTLMNGHILKYNSEENNVYIGHDFYAYDGEITQIDKSREIIIDTIVLNLSTKEIKIPVKNSSSNSFAKALKEEINGKKLLVKNNEKGNKCLFANGIEILEINNNNIVALNFPNVTNIDPYFMMINNHVETINLPNLENINYKCFNEANSLIYFNAPKIKTINNSCFYSIDSLTYFKAPYLQSIGNDSFKFANSLTYFDTPNLQNLGKSCFCQTNKLTSFDAPNLREICNWCFEEAESLVSFNAPNLKTMGNNCFRYTKLLTTFNTPNLQTMGNSCFETIKSLTYFKAPNLISMGYNCFDTAKSLICFKAPKLREMGAECFRNATSLILVETPKLRMTGYACFANATSLTHFEAPNLIKMDDCCFFNAVSLTSFNAPNLKMMESCCFDSAIKLSSINIPQDLLPNNLKNTITKNKSKETIGRLSSLIKKNKDENITTIDNDDTTINSSKSNKFNANIIATKYKENI